MSDAIDGFMRGRWSDTDYGREAWLKVILKHLSSTQTIIKEGDG